MKKFAALLLVIIMATMCLASCKAYNYDDLSKNFSHMPDYKTGLSIDEKDILESLESQIQSMIDAKTEWEERYEDTAEEADNSIKDGNMVDMDIVGFPMMTDTDKQPTGTFSDKKDSFWSSTGVEHIINIPSETTTSQDETETPTGTTAVTDKWSLPGFDSEIVSQGTLPPAPPETTTETTLASGETAPETTTAETTTEATTTEATTAEPTTGTPATDADGSTMTDTDGSVITEPPVTTSEYESYLENEDYFSFTIKVPTDYMGSDADFEPYRGLDIVFFVRINSVSEKIIPVFDDEFVKENTEDAENTYETADAFRKGEYDRIRREAAFAEVYDAFIVKDDGFPKKELKAAYKARFMYAINYYKMYAMVVYQMDLSVYSYEEVITMMGNGMTYDEFKQNTANYAASMVKREMILFYIERKEAFTLTDEMFDKYSKKTFDAYNKANKETADFEEITTEKAYLKATGSKKNDFRDQLLHDYTIDMMVEWVKLNPVTAER